MFALRLLNGGPYPARARVLNRAPSGEILSFACGRCGVPVESYGSVTAAIIEHSQTCSELTARIARREVRGVR
jgi:hypothetical protein